MYVNNIKKDQLKNFKFCILLEQIYSAPRISVIAFEFVLSLFIVGISHINNLHKHNRNIKLQDCCHASAMM